MVMMISIAIVMCVYDQYVCVCVYVCLYIYIYSLRMHVSIIHISYVSRMEWDGTEWIGKTHTFVYR